METAISTKTYPFGHHPDIQDDHPQELYRATDGSFRVIFRQVVRRWLPQTGPLMASLQVPSQSDKEAGLWRAKFTTGLREEIMFSAKLEIARKDLQWGTGYVPRKVIRSTKLPDLLFTRIRMLPHHLELAAGWDLENFIHEADLKTAADAERRLYFAA